MESVRPRAAGKIIKQLGCLGDRPRVQESSSAVVGRHHCGGLGASMRVRTLAGYLGGLLGQRRRRMATVTDGNNTYRITASCFRFQRLQRLRTSKVARRVPKQTHCRRGCDDARHRGCLDSRTPGFLAICPLSGRTPITRECTPGLWTPGHPDPWTLEMSETTVEVGQNNAAVYEREWC